MEYRRKTDGRELVSPSGQLRDDANSRATRREMRSVWVHQFAEEKYYRD
jgi:hypothetical protein